MCNETQTPAIEVAEEEEIEEEDDGVESIERADQVADLLDALDVVKDIAYDINGDHNFSEAERGYAHGLMGKAQAEIDHIKRYT